jgi:spore coat protein CotH
MFNKLKAKAGQPLTYGWLWRCYLGEIIAVGVIYGGMYIYGYITEKKANEAEATEDITVDYDKFEDED